MSADNFVEVREHAGRWHVREFHLSQYPDGSPEEIEAWLREGRDLFDGQTFETDDAAVAAIDRLQSDGYVIEY